MDRREEQVGALLRPRRMRQQPCDFRVAGDQVTKMEIERRRPAGLGFGKPLEAGLEALDRLVVRLSARNRHHWGLHLLSWLGTLLIHERFCQISENASFASVALISKPARICP